MLAGTATARPKAGDGPVEMIRALRVARRSAVKARTQAANQLHALVVTAPERCAPGCARLALAELVAAAAGFRPARLATPTAATKLALRSVARALPAAERRDRGARRRTWTGWSPQGRPAALVAVKGVGTDTAGGAAGDRRRQPRAAAQRGRLRPPVRGRADPGLLRQDQPPPAEPGRRPGRQPGAVPARAVGRMGWDPRTRAYVARRTAEGLSKPEIIRCLKRYLARELYRALTVAAPVSLQPATPHLIAAG